MKKLYSTVIAAIALVVVASLVLAAQAPSITLQTVLDAFNRIPPAWSQILPAAERFVLVMGGAGVLDKETGLVWEQSPNEPQRTWVDAQLFCNIKAVGNRKGWRLPTVHELASLIDPTNPLGDPDLPVGHPFTNVQPSIYWSATSDAGFPDDKAWEVNFFFFPLAGGPEATGKTALHYVWCVRGGIGADPK
jgi:hypothetical protein